jgi:molybdenum cofactor cytidylyltransferase
MAASGPGCICPAWRRRPDGPTLAYMGMHPKIGAVILAAGRASRFGRNKLLEPLGGKAMLRHVAEAALASAAEPVIVVTGNEAQTIHDMLAPLPLSFCENPDFAMGLSTSLKCGVNALPPDCDGVLVLLGDMPGVDAALMDAMIRVFDPQQGRAIIVATRHGRRGNPALWARQFFPEIAGLTGDAGARSLFEHHAGLVFAVEAGHDGPVTDIDTQEAFAAYLTRQPQAAKRQVKP